MNKYYVYAYLREDLTPYYIGKGSGKRAWTSTRVTSKPADPSRICILQNNLTEQEALDIEIKLIAHYKWWRRSFWQNYNLYGRMESKT